MSRNHGNELTLIYTLVALAIALNFPVTVLIAGLLAVAGAGAFIWMVQMFAGI